MFVPRQPTTVAVETRLRSLADAELTYPEIGATREAVDAADLRDRIAARYNIDRSVGELGNGESVYLAACQALRDWRQFEVGWARIQHLADEPRADTPIAIVARTLGLWSANVSRIVYVREEERADISLIRYAYGTTAHHVELGEESFTVEWCRGDDSVRFIIMAFSLPNHWLTRGMYAYTRKTQRRFAADAIRAFRLAVDEELAAAPAKKQPLAEEAVAPAG